MNDNMKLWDAVSMTDPAITKKMQFGAKLTAIDAYSQIMNATKEFGSYGDKWGLTEVDYIFIHETPVALVKGRFKYPDGEFPVNTSISLMFGSKPDDDFAKKAETDLITKALSRLGFNADIFMGKFDDQKYVNEMKKKFEKVNPEPINQERVDGCYEMLKGEIDGDNDEPDYERMQTGISRISNDERLAVFDKFSKEKPEGAKRMYATIISDCLKKKEIDGVWQ